MGQFNLLTSGDMAAILGGSDITVDYESGEKISDLQDASFNPENEKNGNLFDVSSLSGLSNADLTQLSESDLKEYPAPLKELVMRAVRAEKGKRTADRNYSKLESTRASLESQLMQYQKASKPKIDVSSIESEILEKFGNDELGIGQKLAKEFAAREAKLMETQNEVEGLKKSLQDYMAGITQKIERNEGQAQWERASKVLSELKLPKETHRHVADDFEAERRAYQEDPENYPEPSWQRSADNVKKTAVEIIKGNPELLSQLLSDENFNKTLSTLSQKKEKKPPKTVMPRPVNYGGPGGVDMSKLSRQQKTDRDIDEIVS